MATFTTEVKKKKLEMRVCVCVEQHKKGNVWRNFKTLRAACMTFICHSGTFMKIHLLPYLVGSTGGIESVCSTNKQGVIILLQEDFDEIVTLVLRGMQGRIRHKDKKKRKKSTVTFVTSLLSSHSLNNNKVFFLVFPSLKCSM